MVRRQEVGDLDPSGVLDGHERGQQVPQQQVGRRLRADVHVVAHRHRLCGERQHVDGAGVGEHRRRARAARPRAGTPAARTAPGLSLPNHATSPEPCPSGAKARVPPAAFSTTHTGVRGPITVAIGTTTSDSFAGDSVTSPAASSRSAAATSGAQPSATTAARIDRRSGSQASSSSSDGPACSSTRSPTPVASAGTTSAAGRTAVAMGTPVSSRRSTSAFARVDPVA